MKSFCKEKFPGKRRAGLNEYVCYYLVAAIREIANDHYMILATGSSAG
jgi:hypothetical protein